MRRGIIAFSIKEKQNKKSNLKMEVALGGGPIQHRTLSSPLSNKINEAVTQEKTPKKKKKCDS